MVLGSDDEETPGRRQFEIVAEQTTRRGEDLNGLQVRTGARALLELSQPADEAWGRWANAVSMRRHRARDQSTEPARKS
ncbi:hypothetical protein D8770_15065 [Methylobacterium sp. DB1607]|nr:hypothetical protein [Methylobacterium sp. DB1607]